MLKTLIILMSKHILDARYLASDWSAACQVKGLGSSPVASQPMGVTLAAVQRLYS